VDDRQRNQRKRTAQFLAALLKNARGRASVHRRVRRERRRHADVRDVEVAGTGSAARIADAVGVTAGTQPTRDLGEISIRDGGTLILGAAAGTAATAATYNFQSSAAYGQVTITAHAPAFVRAGGTLGGTGRIEGTGDAVNYAGTNASTSPATVNVLAGGVIAPGHGAGDGAANANIGTLYVAGNVLLDAGATAHFDIAGIVGVGSETVNTNDQIKVVAPLENPATSNGTLNVTQNATNIAVSLGGNATAVQIKNDLHLVPGGAAYSLEAAPIILITAEHLFALPGATAVSTATWDTTYGGYNGGTNRVQVDGLTFTIATRLNGSIYEVALVSVSADAAGVPEPSTYAFGGGALLAGVMLVRRRRRRQNRQNGKNQPSVPPHF
jgi:hypothetical protein